MLTFVDANIFIRLFVEHDNERQVRQAEKLLRQAQQGKVDLVTGPPVFFEIAWVLGQHYKIANTKVLDVLEAILSFPGLRVLDKDLVMSSLFLARETNSTFADSYIASSAGDVTVDNVATFNQKHFPKLRAKLYPFG
jgi:predicted nucleic-acid-binding protein